MAITTSQWSHVLTIPESYTPSAATSGQTLVITESVIAKLSAADQTTFWSNVQNGGGDVRICENSDGTNQLPVEVVSLDNVAQTCVIWTRKATYGGTGNLYMFVGKSGETQPPVTDPFGRNAVWADYEVVSHDGGFTESSKGLSPTISGSPTPVSGFLSGGADYGTNTDLYNINYDVLDSDTFTMSVWAFITGKSNNRGQGALGFARDVGSRVSLVADNAPDDWGAWDNVNSWMRSGQTQDVNSWVKVTLVYDGTTERKLYYNEILLVTDSTVSTTSTGKDTFQIGASGNTAEAWHGLLSEAKISFNAEPESKIATEYANQSDPATFYGTPTLDTTAAPTVTADVSYTVSAPTIASSASASLPKPVADASFTVNAPTISVNASATIPGFSASVSFTVSAPTVSSSASATLPNPSANVGYTVSAPTFSVNADASLPQPDSGIAFTVNTPSVSAMASATQAGWNADVNFTVNAPSVSISASANLPQPETTVSFSISPPHVSVVAIVGGIAIIVDDETNINQRVLSNNINAPYLSNNING